MIYHSDVVFYDMVGQLRKNPKLLQKASEYIAAADKIALGIRSGKGKPFTYENYEKIVLASVMACGNNFGALLSGFLPSFRDEKPFSIVERPFMAAMSTLSTGSVTLKAGRQVGKCATGDTTVETDTHGRTTLRNLFEMGRPMTDHFIEKTLL